MATATLENGFFCFPFLASSRTTHDEELVTTFFVLEFGQRRRKDKSCFVTESAG